MATLSTVPVYPAPNRQTTVTFTLTESGSNYVRVWCTNAPPDSAIRKKIDGTSDPRNRVLVYEGDGGADHPWRNSFDVGGKYTLVAQEYTKNATAFGGGYQGDPDGYTSETKAGGETTLSLFIGQRMTSEISVGADRLTLVLWVWDSTIRATTVAVHGEDTPALQAASPTVKAQAAMESAAVQSALDALVAGDGLAVATAVGEPSTILDNAAGGFIKEWNDHVSDAGPHDVGADPDNVLALGLAGSANANNLPQTVNEILRFVRQHYTNDAVEGGAAAGRDTGSYHKLGSSLVNDNVNLPLVQSAPDAQSAYWAIADLHRSYEAHRASTAVHTPADTTNVLSALPALMAVGSAIFTVWASTSPTVPATQSDGAMTLIAKSGFTETPL